MSDTSSEQKIEIQLAESIRLDVKSWPDIRLSEWSRWGFDITEVLRTPRYHILLNPKAPTAGKRLHDNPAIILQGEWFPMNAEAEKRMFGIMWLVYLMGVILFAWMLQAVWAGSGIMAAALFIAMYSLFEGFTTFALKTVAGKKTLARVEILYRSIDRAVLIEKQGVTMLGWEENGLKRGVAMRLSPMAATNLVKEIDETSGNILFRIFKNETLANPPSQNTKR